ncbi:MAG TPA: lipid II flippase MurJ [Candidatus Saccharimonadales bacterium]|nr:lipid II flippase MurJ [Candidatus Saccharimonadales bacterium]
MAMTPFRRLSGLMTRSHNLKQAIGILFVTVLISNVLGLLRNIIIANRAGIAFGSIGSLDNYYAAFALPDFLYQILIVGALASAILPMLVKIDTDGDDEKFWQTYNVLLSTAIVAIVLGVVVLYFVMPMIMPIIFPGFTHENIVKTTLLAQAMLLSPLFFTISQISTSALQAKRRFFAPAIAPIVYNLAIIGAALMLPKYGIPVLVFGVVFGAAAHFLVQMPSLLHLGWKFKFETGFKSREVAYVVKLMVPRAIALTSTQLLLIAYYQIASHFRSGAISIYTLTDDLQTAPVLLLANTLAMAILPDFARHFAKNEHAEFQYLIGKAIRLIIFIFLPVTTFLIMFRQPIMEFYIALGHSIGHQEISSAVATFGFMVMSLFFQGVVLLLARAYFARGDTIKPTVYSLLSLGVSWLLAEIFARTTGLDVAGLALAFSIGSFLNAVLLWFNLKLPLKTLFVDDNGRQNFLWLLLGSLVTAVVFAISREIAPYVSSQLGVGQSTAKFVEIVIGLGLGMGFYLFWSKVLKLEQWQLIKTRQDSTES